MYLPPSKNSGEPWHRWVLHHENMYHWEAHTNMVGWTSDVGSPAFLADTATSWTFFISDGKVSSIVQTELAKVEFWQVGNNLPWNRETLAWTE